MNDYIELDLYLEEDESATIYIHLKDKSLIAFNGVNASPIRMNGIWTISYEFVGRRATGLVPSEDVVYFTIVEGE